MMSILVTSAVLAQSDTVRHFINRMESSPDHASDIRQIQQWLGNKNLTDEFGRDLKKLAELKMYCFIAALLIVSFAYVMGYKP